METFGNFDDVLYDKASEMQQLKMVIKSLQEYLTIFNKHPNLDPSFFSLALDYILIQSPITRNLLFQGHHLEGKQVTFFDPININVDILPIFPNIAVNEIMMEKIIEYMTVTPAQKV